uniref:Uncharacterized protein n=1 Tax=Physcomitrium patens TaxID=3218 RepID=A0A7I4F350_PHYPA
MVQKAGKRRMVYDALQSRDSAEDLTCEGKRGESAESSNWLAGDGSVDSHGHSADKRKTGGWRAAPLIFGTELCERLATLGLQRNLVLYLTKEMHFSNPDSAEMVLNFVGALYLTPFLGGFAADAYLGRFWAITVFATIQVVGMVFLTLSATVSSLRPPPCIPNSSNPCQPSHGIQLGVLYLGLFFFAVGNGGIKPNVSTLGADQFDEGDPNERKQMSHFFNWFYFIISIGSLLSVTLFVYIQDNVGFGWGFGIPAAVMMVAVVVFLAGSRIYRFKPPGGSALTTIAQVAVAATRKRRVCLSHDRTLYEGSFQGRGPVERLNHTDQLVFLDRAAIPVGIKDSNFSFASPWQLCTVTKVEEVKAILKVLPIWASTLLVWTALSQMETFTVEVGAAMDRHVTAKFLFPSASLAVFELFNIIFILPMYDRFFVPFARRFSGHPQGITTLQRIGTGMIFSTLAMLVAALVETKRVQVARDNGLLDRPELTIPMSIFWLVPQNFLRGSTEIFTQIGQLEFFYHEAPERMRSLGSAIYLSTIGCGFFLSSALVTAVNKFTRDGDGPGWLTNNLNRSRLNYFYFLLAALSCANFLLFLVCSSWYKYKKVTSHSYIRIDEPSEA